MEQIYRHTAEMIHRCLEGDRRALIFCRKTTVRESTRGINFRLCSAVIFVAIIKYLLNLWMENQESDYTAHYRIIVWISSSMG